MITPLQAVAALVDKRTVTYQRDYRARRLEGTIHELRLTRRNGDVVVSGLELMTQKGIVSAVAGQIVGIGKERT